MGCHSVVWHRPPGMILWGWLWEPDVACVPGELSALQCPYDRIAITDFATRRIHDIRAAFHLADEGVIKHMLGLGMQCAVDRDDITHTHHRLHGRMISEIQFLLDLLR